MPCPFIITRGRNKGQTCGVNARDGEELCSKHRKSTSTPLMMNHTPSQPKTLKKPTTHSSDQQRIRDLFDLLNNQYLDNTYALKWDQAKRRFGVCRFKKKEIGISLHLLKVNGVEKMLDTVRHEVAHACDHMYDGGSNHGPSWKKWAVKLGTDPKATTHSEISTEGSKYILRHSGTGEVYRCYYRKPTEMGLVPNKYMRADKVGTLGKLEIVPTGTVIGTTVPQVTKPKLKRTQTVKYHLRHIDTKEIYHRYVRKPNKLGFLQGEWITGEKKITHNKLEIVPV